MTLSYNLESLNTLQKGAFGEAFGRMAFALEGFAVYTAEYDDRGVDFVVKSPRGTFYEVQVKTTGETVSPFVYASKFRKERDFLFLAVRLLQGREPALYLASGSEWENPEGCIRFNPGGGSAGPYYEMAFSKKDAASLEQYEFRRYVEAL